MGKKIFVEALEEGQQVDDLFLVKAVRLAETRAGKPYLSLVFADRSGDIGGPAWDNAEALEKICIPGTVVRVCGSVQTYRDRLQLRVDRIAAIDQADLKMEHYLAASSRNPASMESELDQRLSEITNPFVRKLLYKIFHETEEGARFQHAPAAKGIHHAYRGGLLEHSLSMARVAALLAGHYRVVDKDLIIAGALLHDIGKTVELQNEVGVIDYTDIGRLKGHVVIGSEFIADVAAEIEDFPQELLVNLQHLVLSHHGRQEFGSPVVPMTAEALLLSFIDDMDAKMSLIDQLSAKLKTDKPTWSDYQRSLERYILIRPRHDAGNAIDSGAEEDGRGSTRQHTLF